MNAKRIFDEQAAPGVRVAFEADRLLHEVKSSQHQKLIIENPHFGRMMVVDGVVQLSSADEFIYHEMMSHVPVLAHGRVERVLIVGGGDCGLAEEILKHDSVRRVVQVESDPQLIRLARTYFDGINASVFRDARFQLHIANGPKFVASTDERFDLILIDSTDSGELRRPLFTEAFFRQARGCLEPGGLLIAELGVPFLEPFGFTTAMKSLATVFPVASCYLVPMPSFIGGPLALGWASNVVRPEALQLDELIARYDAAGIETRYYTPELHRASFALPRYLKDAVDDAICPDCKPPGAIGGPDARSSRRTACATRRWSAPHRPDRTPPTSPGAHGLV